VIRTASHFQLSTIYNERGGANVMRFSKKGKIYSLRSSAARLTQLQADWK
jgi:hypothetical protein